MDKLSKVEIKAQNPPSGNGGLSKNCKIYVPCSALKTYQQHSDWRNYNLHGYPAFEYVISATSENTMQGTAVVTQEPSCDNNTIAIIEATPKAGYRFVSWNDGNTDNPRSIIVTQDTTFSAIFIEAHVSGITLSETMLQLSIGQTHLLVATVVPEDVLNKNIIWLSSNHEIASVVNGLVTAIDKGTAIITATAEEGGFSASCEVIIKDDTAVENVSADNASSVRKVFENGTIYIIRNGEKYTIDGRIDRVIKFLHKE